MPRKSKRMNPMDFMDIMFQQQNLVMAASETIWHRSMQMALGTMTAGENVSMWMEKPTAVVSGFEDAALAVVSGKSPAQVYTAALAPMTAKASANAKRLRR